MNDFDDDFDEKLVLYQSILELEDWLDIKHNPQILKEVWDTMNDYYCDLQQMRHEIVYSELEENDKASSTANYENIDEVEKKKQIEEAYKELYESYTKYTSIKTFGENQRESYFDNDYEEAEWEQFLQEQEKQEEIDKEKEREESQRLLVARSGTFLYDFSGDDSSLDPRFW
jgi:hypothetical protein